jgi:hypothetical protein
LESDTSIFESGFLPENLRACKDTLNVEAFVEWLTRGLLLPLEPEEAFRFEQSLDRLTSRADYAEGKLAWYLENLRLPDLGGVQSEPDFG